MNMWHENLNPEDRKILLMLSGKLNLPELDKYQCMAHLLHDVYSRICEASSLCRQLARNLGV